MTNNDFQDSIFHSAQLTCVGIPFWTKPGFAIPLFQSRLDSNTTYVQLTNKKRQISGFQIYNERTQIRPLGETRHARIGDLELLALIDPNGRAHVGTQTQLSTVVKAWVHTIAPPLTRMNFARFCGERKLAQSAAFEAVQTKAAEFNDKRNALIWFINSVVVVDLLNALTSNIKDSTEMDMLFDRARVAVGFVGQKISVELPPSTLERKDNARYRKDLAQLLEFARLATQCEIDLRHSSRTTRTATSKPRSSAQHIETLIKEIGNIPRQEERLALVIHALLTEGQAGFELLKRYNDRATFASSVIRSLRKRLNPTSTVVEIEQSVATDIPNLVRTAFPRGRGKLLFYFAEVLGRFEHIASAIRGVVTKSSSYEIAQIRPDILRRLKRASRK